MSARLARFERWMAREIALPAAKPRDARRLGRIEREVEPSHSLSSAQRLAIYADLIRTRLVSVLEQDFVATRRALGTRGFAKLANEYVGRHPSRHFSLNRFGADFPSFVGARARSSKRGAFAAELAELERAVQDVFDGPRDERFDAQALLAIPLERWPKLRLLPIAAARIVSSRYAVDAYLQAVLEGRTPRIVRRKTATLVWRADFAVWRRVLDAREARLFELLRRGQPLGLALSASRASPAQVERWFQAWAADGLFRALARRPKKRRR